MNKRRVATILATAAMASAILGGTVQARQGEPEPGDDRGGNSGHDGANDVARRGEPEPGDDRGGNSGHDGANDA